MRMVCVATQLTEVPTTRTLLTLRRNNFATELRAFNKADTRNDEELFKYSCIESAQYS